MSVLSALTWMRRWHLWGDLEHGINLDRLGCCNSATHSSRQRHISIIHSSVFPSFKLVPPITRLPGEGCAYLSTSISGAEESLQSCRGRNIYCMHAANRVVSSYCRFHTVETDQATSLGERKSNTVWSQITNRWYWNESLWIKCPTYCSLFYCTSIIVWSQHNNGELMGASVRLT